MRMVQGAAPDGRGCARFSLHGTQTRIPDAPVSSSAHTRAPLSPGVDLEDAALGLLVGQRELNLAVDAACRASARGGGWVEGRPVEGRGQVRARPRIGGQAGQEHR